VDQAKSPALARAAGGLALFGALATALSLLPGAFDEADAASLFGFLVLMAWINAPVVGAAACVAASRTQSGGLAFLGVQLLLILAWLGLMVDSLFTHERSTSALAFLTWPLMALPALFAFMGLAYLLGWRARGSWPDPPRVGE
jgi:hypothetical protein